MVDLRQFVVDRFPCVDVGTNHMKLHWIVFVGVKVDGIQIDWHDVVAEFSPYPVAGLQQRSNAHITWLILKVYIVT